MYGNVAEWTTGIVDEYFLNTTIYFSIGVSFDFWKFYVFPTTTTDSLWVNYHRNVKSKNTNLLIDSLDKEVVTKMNTLFENTIHNARIYQMHKGKNLIMGGSWNNPTIFLMPSITSAAAPDKESNQIGFRLIIKIPNYIY